MIDVEAVGLDVLEIPLQSDIYRQGHSQLGATQEAQGWRIYWIVALSAQWVPYVINQQDLNDGESRSGLTSIKGRGGLVVVCEIQDCLNARCGVETLYQTVGRAH